MRLRTDGEAAVYRSRRAGPGYPMRFREKLALSVAPIALRIMVGVAFLWLGLGRVADRIVVEGEDAAILAELGVVGTGAAAQEGPAADAGRVEARRLHRDALMIYRAAHPKPDEAGETPASTWPGALAGGNAPVVLSWAGASIALAGGGLVLLGLFTRVWGLLLVLLVLVSTWLTQLGPAVQSGQTRLGVLPDQPLLNPETGQALLWQFVLLMSAITITLAGSGALALDRMFFGKGGGGGKHG